ncbi:M28 family peptidase [Calycomorphotria hydatis]|uniref:Aminopeptidase YwaD n=1 Tax=Calycomorphotria hydatis TaxID=2528027 RepID=A0A517TDV6_9PLAN|nr:M28 family peptidase [Calycomorphotria hydatis]QDT66558.1 Aminopeptidase YwaD precursor [Calycomorphotria hydatis]
MLSRTLIALLLLATPLFAAERVALEAVKPLDPDVIQAGDVRPHVMFLADETRHGRPGGKAAMAAGYISRHFAEIGLKPLFEESYFQRIPGRTPRDEEGNVTGPRPVQGMNIGGVLPGSDPELADEIIILSAHYDHLGVRGDQVYPGADDNASGVAMLLEVADRLSLQTVAPKRTIVFLAFDLEERMLFGSRYFAANMPFDQSRLKLFITADMIGRSLGGLDLPSVFVLGSEYSSELTTLLQQTNPPAGLTMRRLGVDLIGTRSDYGPFRDRKIPFLFFSTGEHPDYHTPRDVPEKIEYDKLARISELIRDLVREVGNTEEPPQWRDRFEPFLEEAETLNQIATLILSQAEERQLNAIQLLTVNQAKSRTDAVLKRGQMTHDERAWLIRLAQVMLLTVL